MKELKLGAGETVALNVYHRDAKDYYDCCTDLAKVIKDLQDKDYRVPKGENIKIMTPFKPMLALKCNEEDLRKALRKGKVYVENKLDGERLLVHKKGSEIKMFTRNVTDYTDMYKDIQPYIKQAVGEGTECVLDGEIVAWDPEKKIYTEFGTLKHIGKRIDGDDEYRWLVYVIFDILWLHGESLLGYEFEDRRKKLLDLCKGKKQVTFQGLSEAPRIEISNIELLDNMADVKKKLFHACFDQTMKYEGIMMKQANSQYIVNERKDKWMKLKPDMLVGHGDDLDLIVVGGYYGKGSRGGKAYPTEYLCGVPVKGEGQKPKMFHTFCKVGTGLSVDENEVMNQRIKWHEWNWDDPDSHPPHIMMSDWKNVKKDDKPHFWCEPVDSVILQVHGFEITAADTMSAGITVRFPTIERWRCEIRPNPIASPAS